MKCQGGIHVERAEVAPGQDAPLDKFNQIVQSTEFGM